jgi:hypothetical protein
MLEGHHREAEIRLLIDDELVDDFGMADLEGDAHAGMLAQEGGEHVGQHLFPQRGGGNHVHLALLERPEIPHEAAELLEPAEDALHFLLQQLRLARRDEALILPSEQRVAHTVFEPAEDLADGGLRQPHPFRCAGDGAGLHEGAEGFKLPRCGSGAGDQDVREGCLRSHPPSRRRPAGWRAPAALPTGAADARGR